MDGKNTNKISTTLPFTGERYVPDMKGNIELEHLHRYLLAARAVAGKTVLDIACGEGYGSAILARVAYKVTGVDIVQVSVLHAKAKYQAENLEFKIGSCAAIPLADDSVDIVVSFETIEHHDQHEAMMREIKRVLRLDGALIISSPDKLEYSDRPQYINPYHVKELYRDEFKKLLGSYFKSYSVYGQRALYGSAIFCEDRSSPIGTYELADDTLSFVPGVSHPVYLIAVASDVEPPFLGGGVLEQSINEAEAIVERDARINAIYTSYSWRLTRPLRFFARLIKNWLRKFRCSNKF